ncbi:hypothetical protein LC724_13705 [Blautia sp. RD014234]|nr:hypothetical protein [Blautia parvula]
MYDEKVSKALILDKNREIVTSKDYESVGQVYEGVDRLPSTSGIESQDAREIRIFYQGHFPNAVCIWIFRKVRFCGI